MAASGNPPIDERGEITRALSDLAEGDDAARERLYALVYAELRRLAGIRMRHQPVSHTLTPTDLVHETCVRILGRDALVESRAHFLNAAARAMRTILVDHARRRMRTKRGGGKRPVSLEEGLVGQADSAEEVIAVDESLARLAAMDPRKARLLELRYFAGLPFKEVAQLMGMSERSVFRLWDHTRAWLLDELSA